MEKVDLVNRDSNNINEHMLIEFEDVLAEPHGSHSNDCVWQISYLCFSGTKLCCYRCLTVFCSWLMSCAWGFSFACLAFFHIWCVTPCIRNYAINMSACQKCWGICVQCFVAPICESAALCFSKIRLTNG